MLASVPVWRIKRHIPISVSILTTIIRTRYLHTLLLIENVYEYVESESVQYRLVQSTHITNFSFFLVFLILQNPNKKPQIPNHKMEDPDGVLNCDFEGGLDPTAVAGPTHTGILVV